MFFHGVDFLSPQITLFFKGRTRHASIFSGIFSLFYIAFTVVICLGFFLAVLLKSTPKGFFFKKHFYSQKIININPSSLFHFVTIESENAEVSSFSAIGFNQNPEHILNIEDTSTYDHWIYSVCNPSYTIGDDIVYRFDSDALCITSFYNSTSKKTVPSTNSDFSYPFLTKESYEIDSHGYGFFLMAKEDYDFSISSGTYTIHFTTNFIDTDNYQEPFTRMLYNFSQPIHKRKPVSTVINFIHSMIETSGGIFLKKNWSLESHLFSHVEQSTMSELAIRSQPVVGGVRFTILDYGEMYIRTYNKMYDALAYIGGLSKVAYAVFFFINKLYNDCVIITDINQMFDIDIGHKMFQKRGSVVRMGKKTKDMNVLTANKVSKINTISEWKKWKKVRLWDVFLHNAKIRTEKMIDLIRLYRERILSEEKIFKVFLVVKTMRKHWGESFIRRKMETEINLNSSGNVSNTGGSPDIGLMCMKARET